MKYIQNLYALLRIYVHVRMYQCYLMHNNFYMYAHVHNYVIKKSMVSFSYIHVRTLGIDIIYHFH